MLARLNYIMGDHQEALQYQQKAVLMSERVNGIDHPYTIAEYVSGGARLCSAASVTRNSLWPVQHQFQCSRCSYVLL